LTRCLARLRPRWDCPDANLCNGCLSLYQHARPNATCSAHTIFEQLVVLPWLMQGVRPRPPAALGDLEDLGAAPGAAAAAAAARRTPVGVATSSLEVRSPGGGGRGREGVENADAANVQRGRQSGAAAASQQQAAEVEEELPDPGADYKGWLAGKKRQWRASREVRKRRRLERGTAAEPPPAAAADVGAMFRQQAAAATAAHWQVVAIAPTQEPGVAGVNARWLWQRVVVSGAALRRLWCIVGSTTYLCGGAQQEVS
jgi:hypothetical protein